MTNDFIEPNTSDVPTLPPPEAEVRQDYVVLRLGERNRMLSAAEAEQFAREILRKCEVARAYRKPPHPYAGRWKRKVPA